MSQYPNKKWRLTFIIKIRREIMDIKYIVRLIILYVQYTVWLLLLKIRFDLIKSEYLILGRRLEQLCNANTRWQMELIALNKIYWDKLVLVLSLINAINTNRLPPLYTGPEGLKVTERSDIPDLFLAVVLNVTILWSLITALPVWPVLPVLQSYN